MKKDPTDDTHNTVIKKEIEIGRMAITLNTHQAKRVIRLQNSFMFSR